MKNFIAFMIFAFIGLATYAAPPAEKVTPLFGTSISEAVFDLVLSTSAEMDMGNSSAISVDKLKGAEWLYASAVAPEGDTVVEESVLTPPNVTIDNLLDIPGKKSPWTDWFKWGASIAVLAIYEVWQRKRPTNNSWSIPGIIYRLLNVFVKDKGKGDGSLNIQRE